MSTATFDTHLLLLIRHVARFLWVLRCFFASTLSSLWDLGFLSNTNKRSDWTVKLVKLSLLVFFRYRTCDAGASAVQ
jgi:hypothetical protein